MSDGRLQVLPLLHRDGHLFVEVGGDLWLLDTGAPSSFGRSPRLRFCGQEFGLGTDYLGLSADGLSNLVGVPCFGLLGADVLGRFDHLIDLSAGRLTVSAGEASCGGEPVHLDEFMGIPIVTARIAGADFRMFLDTGAQFSYLEDPPLAGFPHAGRVRDFYPGIGPFETDTFEVPVTLGGLALTLRCGSLPGLLGATLMLAGTKGIVGNEILRGRTVGYFPRRRMLVL